MGSEVKQQWQKGKLTDTNTQALPLRPPPEKNNPGAQTHLSNHALQDFVTRLLAPC